MSGRKPDYKIRALNKTTEVTGELGAAWLNPDGTITIVFNAFVAVPTSRDVVITMFKNEFKLKDERQPAKQPLQKIAETEGEVPW